jgi:hypothetical protein
MAALIMSCSSEEKPKPNCSELRDPRSVDPAGGPPDDPAVVRPVTAFYAGFNADFECNFDFATANWAHINPFGHVTTGEQVLEHLRDIHATFLKGVSETVEQMRFRWIDSGVALVTVTSKVSPYQLPGEARRENERQRRTFVVVRRGDSWLVLLDHNTIVAQGDDGGEPDGAESAAEPPVRENDATTEDARRQGARAAADAFYAAFERHSFENASDFASEEWDVIDSSGLWTVGREAVVAVLEEQHASYLATVDNAVEGAIFLFADDTIATVTITSRLSNYTTPDGVDHENEQQISTFVVTEQDNHWYSVRTQQTVVAD